MLITEDEIEQVFRFGTPIEVRVKSTGHSKLVRKAEWTQEKQKFYNLHRIQLGPMGVTYGPKWMGKQGELEFSWWQSVPEDVTEARKKSVEMSAKADTDFQVPVREGETLYPYQRAGIEYMHSRNAALNADEMGLGKTAQVIGVLNLRPEIRKVLIICPNRVRYGWVVELNKFSINQRSVGFVEKGVVPSSEIVIIHYDIVAKHEKALSNIYWDLVVIDECHMLRNKTALRTRAVLGGRADKKKGIEATSGIPAKTKFCLTGTPIAKDAMNLFPFLRWMDRAFWGTYTDFFNAYGVDNRRHPELHRRLREWGMIRRKKVDVAKDLPPKTRQTVVIEATTAEQRAVVAHDQKLLGGRGEALERMLSDDSFDRDVEAAVISFLKVPATEIAATRLATGMAIVQDAIEFIENVLEQEDKVVIFAHHVQVMNRLREALRHYGLTESIGGMAATKSFENVQRFKGDPNIRVFLASLMATGTGVNGLQEAANVAIFVEDDFTPITMDQAEDRMHRWGQRNPVTIYHLALAGSIAIRILKINIEKRKVSSVILDGASLPPEKPQTTTPPGGGMLGSLFGKRAQRLPGF